jgi:DNA-binding beta-propeller fold protein YncE
MRWLIISAVLLAAGLVLVSQQKPATRPGPQADGSTLLPNGWSIRPAGRQIATGTLPMSSQITPDGKFLLVLQGGYMPPSLSVFDAATMNEVHKLNVPDGWLGLTLSSNGRQVYVGGGATSSVYEFGLSAEGRLTEGRTFPLVEPAKRVHQDFTGDVALSPDGRLLYVAMLYRDAIYVVNPQSGMVIERWRTGRRPYRIAFHPDGKSLYVSSWADAAVWHHNASDGARLGLIRTGPHPTDMVFSSRRPENAEENESAWAHRLFVAAANTNRVHVFGLNAAKDVRPLEVLNVALYADQPAGMTPSALALDKEEKRLFVVCSDANAVAAVDISGAKSSVDGFVPTGWYPTAARVLPNGSLVVLNGRGARSFPNPQGPNPAKKTAPVHQGNVAVEYVGKIQTGSLSLIAPFGEKELAAHTATVRQNSPYRPGVGERAAIPAGNPIPSTPGGASPIEHVIYILKENRTYDQVFGDLGIGNGDPALTLFDESTTANHRKLAREFVLLDNFYVNADVSADGHNWSSAAIAPDYVQKMWPNSYGGRRKHYDYEGGEVAALPPAGYLWNNAAQAGVSLRNFGWWATNAAKPLPDGDQIQAVRDQTLAPVTSRKFRGFDLDYLDVDRAKVFIAELNELERAGASLPRLTLLRLGNDHTSGVAPGKYSPRAAMADNDWALGQIVEAVSKSKFWAKTAIFVIEDDAQNGPDHVDSHRSPAFVLSPYTRRAAIDSTFYNTTSVLRTMELLLGLKPMTSFDAAATPMWNVFASQPNGEPYTAVQPRHPINERNPAANTQAAVKSAALDLAEADRIDDDELNDILWRALKQSEPPVPTRSIFGR